MRGAFRPGAAPSVAGGYGGLVGRRVLVFLGLLLLALGVVLGVGQGAVPIAPGEVVRALLGQSENPIITELRLPGCWLRCWWVRPWVSQGRSFRVSSATPWLTPT